MQLYSSPSSLLGKEQRTKSRETCASPHPRPAYSEALVSHFISLHPFPPLRWEMNYVNVSQNVSTASGIFAVPIKTVDSSASPKPSERRVSGWGVPQLWQVLLKTIWGSLVPQVSTWPNYRLVQRNPRPSSSVKPTGKNSKTLDSKCLNITAMIITTSVTQTLTENLTRSCNTESHSPSIACWGYIHKYTQNGPWDC